MTTVRAFGELAKQAASLGLLLAFQPGARSPYRLAASTDSGSARPVAFKTREGVARYLDELAGDRNTGVRIPKADAVEAGRDDPSNKEIDAAIRAAIVRLGYGRLIELLQEAGQAVVYLDDDEIVHEHPDRKREVIGHLGDDTPTLPATPPS